MSKKTISRVRFTIDAEGQPRTLFSAYEKANGAVYIRPKKDPHFRFPGQHPDGIKKPIYVSSQKYSIHPSENSPQKVNTIHSTTVLEGYEPLEWRHLTKAIKKEVGFAFLNLRRCSSLAQPHFVSQDTNETTVSLGAYDPKLFTLYYAIIAGAKDSGFNHDGETDIGYIASHQLNVVEHVLERSRLIVLWSFLAAPSHSTSLIFHNTTVEPKTEADKKLMDGSSNEECVSLFSQQCGVLENEQRAFLMMEAGKPLHEPCSVPVKRWFQDGMTDTGATAAYIEEVTMRVATR